MALLIGVAGLTACGQSTTTTNHNQNPGTFDTSTFDNAKWQ